MYRLLFGFLILLLSLTAQATGLEQASQSQLKDLERVIQERLVFFSFLSTLDSGIPPQNNDIVRSSINEYTKLSQLSHVFLKNFSEQEICTKFQKTFNKIQFEIANNLSQIQSKKLSTDKLTLLESRLSVLSHMRAQLVSLIESDQEGGVEPLTQKASICLTQQRNQFKEALKNETQALQTVLQSKFGVRGLREANRLSTSLGALAERHATKRLHWFLPKTIALTAVSLMAWELVVVRGVSTLVSVGSLTPVAAKSLSTALSLGSTGIMIGIGAYQGAKIASSKVPLISLSELDYILSDMQSFVDLPLNSPEALFDRIFLLEGQLSQELLKLKRETKSDKDLIISKWGSIDRAIQFHQNKLSEVQSNLRL